VAAAEQVPSGLPGHLLAGRRVVVAGASGCVGRLLLPELLAAGADVVALSRRPETLSGVPLIERVRINMASDTALRRAVKGADAVIDVTRGAPSDTGELWLPLHEAATAAGVHRVVALRCMADAEPDVTVPPPAGVEVVLVRATPIVAAGSAPVVALRRLAERAPLMTTGRWASQPAQPVAVADVVRHLVALAARQEPTSGTLELGGPDVVTLREMLEEVGRAVGRRPLLASLPLDVGALSAFAFRAFAGADEATVRTLLRPSRPLVVRDERIRRLVPAPLVPFPTAVRAAIAATRRRGI
jgi:uncharacterized protein YbjT (DUF2867 family)